jgi:hypothetical protein
LLLNNLLFFSPKFQTKEMMNHAGTQSGWSPDGNFISASTLGGTETESPYTLDIVSDGHVMLTEDSSDQPISTLARENIFCQATGIMMRLY